jgi:multidrug efflux pump subunit AcrA (membrane-fusion protein)
LAIARQRLTETVVKAPSPADAASFPGAAYAVSHRSVTAGSYVHAGDEVFRLVIDKTLKLRLPIPDMHANDVHDGQCVEIISAGLSEPILGTVARINPRVDPATHTFEVEVQVPNRRFLMKAGSIAHACIPLGHAREAATAQPKTMLTADTQAKVRAASARAAPSLGIGE